MHRAGREAVIGEWVYDLFGGSLAGLALAIFLIFLLDALLIPALPELFFIIAYMGGRSYGAGPEFGLSLIAVAAAAELIGIFTLYYVVRHIRIPKKVEKLVQKYTGFLVLGDERLLLLNRIAPVIPFAGAFIAISGWNAKKSAGYIILGCVVKFGVILLLSKTLYTFFDSNQAEIFSIIMIFAVIGISTAMSLIYKKKHGLNDSE